MAYFKVSFARIRMVRRLCDYGHQRSHTKFYRVSVSLKNSESRTNWRIPLQTLQKAWASTLKNLEWATLKNISLLEEGKSFKLSIETDDEEENQQQESVVVTEIQDGWSVEVVQNGDDDDSTVPEKNSKKEKGKKSQYPVRPGEPDCVFYLKTGNYRFGSNCKFNHSPKKKLHKARATSIESPQLTQVVGEDKADNPRRVGQLEWKYYLTPGGCKFGKGCRYNHPREKSVGGTPVDFNFLGLPIRPGQRECPFYMRTGSCKFATNCRFNHPDPTAGGSDSGFNGTNLVPLHSSNEAQSTVASWSIPRPSADTNRYFGSSQSYMPVMLQPQGLHSSVEWNGYQTPVSPIYPPEGTLHPPIASSLNGSHENANGYMHHLQQMPGDEYPERPSQKECQFYMKIGDCKYKSACRFHHPKAQVSKAPTLTPLGLPLRPDQIPCIHFSHYGIYKYGAACKYDHSPNPNTPVSPIASGLGPFPYYHNPAAYIGAPMANAGDGSRAFVQQLV